MANDLYTRAFNVTPGNRVGSQLIENEFAAVEAALDKLPTLPQMWSGSSNYAVAGGAVNVYTATIANTHLTGYTDGLSIIVKFGTPNNNTTPTINLNALGAKTIERADGTALAVGELKGINQLTYNSSSGRFQITSVSGINITAAAAADASANAAASSATSAATSAATAALFSNAVAWVSGTTYSAGIAVYSAINFLAYRRKTTGAGTIDPSIDTTNYALLNTLQPLPSVQVSGIVFAQANVDYQMTAQTSLSLPSTPLQDAYLEVTNISGLVTCEVSSFADKIMGFNEGMFVDALNVKMKFKYTGASFGWFVSIG